MKSGGLFDLEAIAQEIETLEKHTVAPDFWDDNREAQRILRRISDLRETLETHNRLQTEASDLKTLLQMAQREADEELYAETAGEIERLFTQFEDYELTFLFSGEYDKNNAIVSLHSGAGGTDAQDWVEMLLRMYTRYAENYLSGCEVWDLLPGDEAGIKSTTFLVRGKHAYGKMKCERGVHRLVRVSPFDASGRRHTSFAQVVVLPELPDEGQAEINPDDLKIDTYRSGGAGGQHVNKTDSAVRITHLPSGVVVQCQNERSQHANKDKAMKILQARLFELHQRQQEENAQKLKGEHKDIAWGSQIRSYTLNPFSLVKDHRTGVEIGNVEAVLNGEIEPLISAYLHAEAENALREEE